MPEWQAALATATFAALSAVAAVLAAMAVDEHFGLMSALVAALAAAFLQIVVALVAGPLAEAVRTLAGGWRSPVESEDVIVSLESARTASFSRGGVECAAEVPTQRLLSNALDIEDHSPESGSDWESALGSSVVSSSASERQCHSGSEKAAGSGSEKLSGSEKNSEQSNCPSTDWEFLVHESLRNDFSTTHDDFLHPDAFLYSVGPMPPFGVQPCISEDPIVTVEEEKEKLSSAPPVTMATVGQGGLLGVASHAIGAPIATVAKTPPSVLPLGNGSAAVATVAEIGGAMAPAALAAASPGPVVVVAGHSPEEALRTAAALGTVVAGGTMNDWAAAFQHQQQIQQQQQQWCFHHNVLPTYSVEQKQLGGQTKDLEDRVLGCAVGGAGRLPRAQSHGGAGPMPNNLFGAGVSQLANASAGHSIVAAPAGESLEIRTPSIGVSAMVSSGSSEQGASRSIPLSKSAVQHRADANDRNVGAVNAGGKDCDDSNPASKSTRTRTYRAGQRVAAKRLRAAVSAARRALTVEDYGVERGTTELKTSSASSAEVSKSARFLELARFIPCSANSVIISNNLESGAARDWQDRASSSSVSGPPGKWADVSMEESPLEDDHGADLAADDGDEGGTPRKKPRRRAGQRVRERRALAAVAASGKSQAISISIDETVLHTPGSSQSQCPVRREGGCLDASPLSVDSMAASALCGRLGAEVPPIQQAAVPHHNRSKQPTAGRTQPVVPIALSRSPRVAAPISADASQQHITKINTRRSFYPRPPPSSSRLASEQVEMPIGSSALGIEKQCCEAPVLDTVGPDVGSSAASTCPDFPSLDCHHMGIQVVGQWVLVQHLVKNTHFNGRWGFAESYDPHMGRYNVKVFLGSDHTQAVMAKLRRNNFQLMAPPASPSAMTLVPLQTPVRPACKSTPFNHPGEVAHGQSSEGSGMGPEPATWRPSLSEPRPAG